MFPLHLLSYERTPGWAVNALAICLAFTSALPAEDADPPSLLDIREGAYAWILAVDSIQFDFDVEQSNGWKSRGRFFLEGNRFRTEREDVTGLWPGSAPENSISAFDAKRSQFFSESQSRLILKDGPDDQQYTLEAPFSIIYAWLRSPGMPLRWAELKNPATWTKRFAEAQYIGRENRGDLPVTIVSFPDLVLPNRACEYRVSFAPTLGYLPLSYERTVVATEKLASRMQVTRWTEQAIDSITHVIPLEVSFEQSDADGASLPVSRTMKVAAETLKINEVIDNSLFTIPASIAVHVHDIDEHQKAFAQASVSPHPPTPITEGSRRNMSFIIGIVVANIAFLAALGLYWLRRRKA